MAEVLRPTIEYREAEKPLCRAYHWTPKNNLPFITQKTAEQPGLIPRTGLIFPRYDTQKAYLERKRFLFCLMNDPYPQEWQQHPDIFYNLIMKKMGGDVALMSFDVYAQDQPYIVDLIHAREHLKDGELDDTFYATEDGKAYLQSMQTVQSYSGGYILPELIIPEPGSIAVDRLTVEHVSSDFFEKLRAA